jgi:5-methylcytosine-specific restriction endonuclease McrA
MTHPRANYKKYLLSSKWRATANDAIERAGYRCQVCGNPFRLQVHHNTYRNLGKEQPEDLCVLCKDCHELFHSVIAERRRPRPKREEVRKKVACPTCGVPAGEMCLGSVGGGRRRKRREANHIARVNVYINL